jgi:ribosomal-protein-alanine acetyltransferase
VLIRSARAGDRPAIVAIQQASPEASAWDPTGYDVTVAEAEGRIEGFLVTRSVGAGEWEILNLAVAPVCRRRGVASALLWRLIETCKGVIFLEVRESNSAARNLYQSIGFKELSVRPGYYSDPQEAAIVLKFHSC